MWVSKPEFHTLDPKKWLSDVVIDALFVLITERFKTDNLYLLNVIFSLIFKSKTSELVLNEI